MSWWVVAGCATAAVIWLPGAGGRAALRGRSGGSLVSARRFRHPRTEPEVLGLLDGLAAELSAGQPPRTALLRAAEALRSSPCPLAVRAIAVGADIADAMRRDALVPGAGDLRSLAACWEVAEYSGSGLATAVAHLAEAVRTSVALRGERAAEVSAARASARVLAGLPVLGLLLGQWLGADPLGWLLGGWTGLGVLAVGIALQAGGSMWLRTLVAGCDVGR